VIPATVSLDVSWTATGPRNLSAKAAMFRPPTQRRSLGVSDRPGLPERFSGSELGRFRSTEASSAHAYAEIGTERNGSFL
jgi:hypothetical protein